MPIIGSHDHVRADHAPEAEHRTMRARTNGRCRMWKRLGAAVVGAVSTTTLMSGSPAAAAEPHHLSRTDSYTFRSSSGATLTCIIDGFNVLFEDGDGGLSVFSSGAGECGRAHVAMTVSYIDTTGTPVTFDAAADGGFVTAQVHNVESDLKVQYRVHLIQFCNCTSETFSLPNSK